MELLAPSSAEIDPLRVTLCLPKFGYVPGPPFRRMRCARLGCFDAFLCGLIAEQEQMQCERFEQCTPQKQQ